MHKNAKLLQDQLKEFISNTTLSVPSLVSQSVILGHINLSNDYLFINHLVLVNSRNRGYLNIEHLKASTDKTKSIEEEISKNKPKKKRSKY